MLLGLPEERCLSWDSQGIDRVLNHQQKVRVLIWLEYSLLQYTRKRSGPSIEPCGTPEVTGIQSEQTP